MVYFVHSRAVEENRGFPPSVEMIFGILMTHLKLLFSLAPFFNLPLHKATEKF